MEIRPVGDPVVGSAVRDPLWTLSAVAVPVQPVPSESMLTKPGITGVVVVSPTVTAVPAPDTFRATQPVGSKSQRAGTPFFVSVVAFTTADACVVSVLAPTIPPKKVGRVLVTVTDMRSHAVPYTVLLTARKPSVMTGPLSATG